jgi:hypothetical protein
VAGDQSLPTFTAVFGDKSHCKAQVLEMLDTDKIGSGFAAEPQDERTPET